MYFPSTPKELFRKTFCEVIDRAVSGINERFHQPGYQVFETLENIVLKAAKGKDFLPLISAEITKKYCEDINFDGLISQLNMLPNLIEEPVEDFSSFLKWFQSTMYQHLLSQVGILLKLLLVLPATNAMSERSFSTLRRVKTYLRSTMSQDRLNSLMILHIYKEHTSALDPQVIISRFVGVNKRRAERIRHTV